MLLLNDFNTSMDYEILIDGCLNAGVPISAIGISCEGRSAYVKLLDDTQMSVAVTDPCHSSEDDA